MKYKYITIIPARGGSKRFPGKNTHVLNGKPLICHSIEYSLQNVNISRTCVFPIILHFFTIIDNQQVMKKRADFPTARPLVAHSEGLENNLLVDLGFRHQPSDIRHLTSA